MLTMKAWWHAVLEPLQRYPHTHNRLSAMFTSANIILGLLLDLFSLIPYYHSSLSLKEKCLNKSLLVCVCARARFCISTLDGPIASPCNPFHKPDLHLQSESRSQLQLKLPIKRVLLFAGSHDRLSSDTVLQSLQKNTVREEKQLRRCELSQPTDFYMQVCGLQWERGLGG